MKRKLLLAALMGLVSQPLFATDIIIDDFKTGHISQMSIQCGIIDKTVSATVPGKHRWVRLQLNEVPACEEGNPFTQTVSANIQSGQPLIVNNGYKVRSRTELHYGRTNEDLKFPMGLDLTLGSGKPGYIEVTFAAAAAGINLNVGVFTKGGAHHSACGINVPPNANGFTVAFPLAKFKRPDSMQADEFQDVSFLSIVAQTADGNFGISQVKATAQPTASAIQAEC